MQDDDVLSQETVEVNGITYYHWCVIRNNSMGIVDGPSAMSLPVFGFTCFLECLQKQPAGCHGTTDF